MTKSYLAALLAGFLLVPSAANAATLPADSTSARLAPASSIARQLQKLEQQSGGRLGVAVLDTANGNLTGWRLDERFPMCSTSKVMAVAALLKRSEQQPQLIAKTLPVTRENLVNYNPVTERHLGQTMTLAQLSAATLQYSDNAAMNMILNELGGPAAVTAFARQIGDTAFRLDRTEPTLNSALPGDPRDTTTPRAQALSLQKLVLTDGLAASQRQQLVSWMKGNTTGDASIRAGLPAGWKTGDKTGSGDYGTTNDIAVVWPVSGASLLITTYYTQFQPDAASRREVLAAAARIVAQNREMTAER